MRAMRTKIAIEHFGGVPALAAALKVRPQAIYQCGEDVPLGRAYQIEVLSAGMLRANGAHAPDIERAREHEAS